MNEGFSITRNDLPKPLDKKEQERLIQIKDKESRDKLVLHNLRLISYFTSKYKPYIYDNDDLFQIGVLALIKAIDTYDINKKVEFSTYASSVIKNDIFKFFNGIKKLKDSGEKNNTIDTMFHIIDPKMNLEWSYFDKEEKDTLYKEINKLEDREKNMILMYYGFFGRKYSLMEIGNLYGIKSPRVCKIIKKAISKIKDNMTNGKVNKKVLN